MLGARDGSGFALLRGRAARAPDCSRDHNNIIIIGTLALPPRQVEVLSSLTPDPSPALVRADIDAIKSRMTTTQPTPESCHQTHVRCGIALPSSAARRAVPVRTRGPQDFVVVNAAPPRPATAQTYLQPFELVYAAYLSRFPRHPKLPELMDSVYSNRQYFDDGTRAQKAHDARGCLRRCTHTL